MNDVTAKPWYDTKEGIEAQLTTLKNFHNLLDARKIAHEKKEKLDEFYVFQGAYNLDDGGKCSRFQGDNLPKDLPLVANHYEFWSLIRKYDASRNALTLDEIEQDQQKAKDSGRPWPTSYEVTLSNDAPPRYWVVCPECRAGWHIASITDYVKEEPIFQFVPVGEYVGKPLKTLWEAYEKKTDAEYNAPPKYRVRNVKNVTPSNVRGFYPDNNGITDPEYLLQKRDMISFEVMQCFHKQCLETAAVQKKETQMFQKKVFERN